MPAASEREKEWQAGEGHPIARRLVSVNSVLIVLAAWYLIAHFRLVPPLFLPGPPSILELFSQEGSTLVGDIGRTMLRMALGFTLGSLSGVALACFLSWSRTAAAFLEPILQVLKPIPALVLTAFAILWFGTELSGIVAITAWGCFIIMVIETREAIKNVSTIYLWAGAALGASRGMTYRRIILPAILPGIIGGLRVAVVMAFNLTLLMEFRAGVGGIGYLLIRGYTFLRTNVLFAAIICMVVAALLVDLSLARALRRAVRWVP